LLLSTPRWCRFKSIRIRWNYNAQIVGYNLLFSQKPVCFFIKFHSDQPSQKRPDRITTRNRRFQSALSHFPNTRPNLSPQKDVQRVVAHHRRRGTRHDVTAATQWHALQFPKSACTPSRAWAPTLMLRHHVRRPRQARHVACNGIHTALQRRHKAPVAESASTASESGASPSTAASSSPR